MNLNKGNRLYKLLLGIIAAGIGLYFFMYSREILQWHVFNISSSLNSDLNQWEQLLNKKKALLESSGYDQIDDIIAIEKQIKSVDDHMRSVSIKQSMLTGGVLLLIGLLLMALSIFVMHEMVRLFLAAIGAVFFVGAIEVQVVGIITKLSLLLAFVIYLLCAVSFYMIGHFVSKKYGQAHRYICLQLCGIFSLIYALFMLPTILGNLFRSEELKSFDRINKKLRPLIDEQEVLLKTEQLSDQQKERYINILKEIEVLNVAWEKEYFSSSQDEHEGSK